MSEISEIVEMSKIVEMSELVDDFFQDGIYRIFKPHKTIAKPDKTIAKPDKDLKYFDYDKIECNIENLIDLKFSIMEQLDPKFVITVNNTKKYMLYFISNNPDIYKLFMIYNNNITIKGPEFYKIQLKLLQAINYILLTNCDHNWIESSKINTDKDYHIRTCPNCYVQKRVYHF